MRRTLTRMALVAVVAAVTVPTLASAQDNSGSTSSDAPTSTSAESALKQRGALFDASEFQRPSMLSFFAFMPYASGIGIGVGGRYTLPILASGFISKLNDSVELEFGVDALYASWVWGGYFGVGIPAEGRWSFHITDKFTAYAKVGIGWLFYFGSSLYGFGTLYPQAGPGILYQFTDTLYLRAEVGYGGLRAGLGMTF